MRRLALLTAYTAIVLFRAAPAQAADAQAVARIHGAIVDCVASDYLMNTCFKQHDLHDGADATLMCMSFANFTNASFRGTE